MKNSIQTACLLLLNIALASMVNAASFESSTDGWKSDHPASIRSVTAADGAPAAAITDGKSCLELTAENGEAWCQLAVQKDLLAKIKESDTLSFDLFVPESSLPKEGWAKVQVRLFGGKGEGATFDLTEEIVLNLQADKSYQVEWNYAAHPDFDPSCFWAQIAIVKVASGGSMSPLYIDNFKFRKAPALKSSDIFLLDDSWKLVWEDDFKGEKGTPPPEHWRLGAQWNEDGTWRDSTPSREEAYLDGNGNLVLRTRYKDGKRLAPYLVTSEAGTYSKEQSLTFGPGEHGIFIEWRVNVSQFKAYAAWFALWLYSETPYVGDPAKGSEIDVMEYLPFENDSYTLMNKFNAAVHVADDGSGSVGPPTPYGHTEFDADRWHTWGLHWTKDRQVFYLDGKPYWVNTKYVSPTEDHGLRMTIEIANGDPEKGDKNIWGHAVGKFEDNPESRLPSYAYVDYVRVYKKIP